jgi:hypothetical protein
MGLVTKYEKAEIPDAEEKNEQNNRLFGYPAGIVNHQRWFSFQ